MKKKYIVLLIILAVVLIPLIVFIAVDLKHYYADKSPYRTLFIPRLEAGVFEITDLELDRVKLNSKMLIKSPLPFNLAADSLQYQIFISGKEVIKSSYAKSLNIRKWDSTWIDLPVTVYNEKLFAALSEADKLGKDSVVYRIKTTFFTHLPFKQNFDIDVDKLLPLIYIPTVGQVKVDYDSLSLKGITLYIRMMIGNRNKVDLQFKDLKYKVQLADYPWVYGAKWGEVNIKAQDSTELVLPLRISFTDVFKTLGPLIRKGGKTDYKVGLDLKLVSEMNALKNSKVVFANAGTVSEIVSLAKEVSSEAKEKKEAKKEAEKETKKEIRQRKKEMKKKEREKG